MPPGRPERGRLRARAIEDNLPLANRMARRYAGRGEHPDDLAQVAASADLTQLHGRSPTPVELAGYLKVSVDDLLTAERAAQMYRPPSLNAPLSGQGENGELGDLIGELDPDYECVDERMSRESLRSLIAALPQRERRIVIMRFYDEMTQDRIADEIGISQMHVSRLLKQTLAELRTAYLAADAGSGTPSRCRCDLVRTKENP